MTNSKKIRLEITNKYGNADKLREEIHGSKTHDLIDLFHKYVKFEGDIDIPDNFFSEMEVDEADAILEKFNKVVKAIKSETCTEDMEIYARVVGYVRPISNFNKGKVEEFKMRTSMNIKATSEEGK